MRRPQLRARSSDRGADHSRYPTGTDPGRCAGRRGLVASASAIGAGSRGAASASATGLVAAYSFNEGTGASATDVSGNGHPGTIAGASWTNDGRYGGALSFDGTDDRVDLGSLGTFYQSGFTLEAWVRKTSDTKKDVTVLGTWTGGGAGPMVWVDHLEGRYRLTAGQGLENYLDSGETPVAGTWQHLAATFDGTVARFYVDGAEVADRTVSGGFGGSNTWQVGAYDSTPTGFFDGVIDEIRIYSRALSEAEIVADRDEALGRPRYDAAERSRHPHGYRRVRPGEPHLGRRHGRGRGHSLQRPPLDDGRLHPRCVEPRGGADRHELHRLAAPGRHVLLPGDRTGCGRQRRAAVEPGQRDGRR